MYTTARRLFPSLLVEKPVENVEKSTVFTVAELVFPIFPKEISYTAFMHKVCFFRFFLNYVAMKFPVFFEEKEAKSSGFEDLAKTRKADKFFSAQIFVKFPQKFTAVCFFLSGT